jgi:ketosteroid isomerase-like protein
MPEDLPSTVATYFAATNRHDVAAMIAVFTDDGAVKDEGREHRGSSAIRAWIEETIRKYDFRAEPSEVAREHGWTVVTAIVSGSFPGSPVTLRYRFQLDGEKVARLEIG